MTRIALVESRFGNTSSGSSGGIWKISAAIKLSLQTLSTTIQVLVFDAGCILGQDNTNLTNSNYGIPLHSAFAARIFIQKTFGSNALPTTLAQQAAWWSTVYHPGGNATLFIEIVSKFENTPACNSHKLDLWFTIDGSGSVGSSNFQATLRFMESLINGFDIGPGRVHVGFSVYQSNSRILSHFNQHTSKSSLAALIRGTSYPGGGTATGAAITDVINNGFVESRGARKRSEGVPRILVVLTDGQSGDSVSGPSNAARAAGIAVFAVGIGGGIDATELGQIANNPDSRYVFRLSNFGLLDALKERLQQDSCMATAAIPDNSAVSVQVASGDTYFSKYTFPSNGSITLVYQVPQGSNEAVVYISGSVENPSSALSTISFKITVGTVTIHLNADSLTGGFKLGSGCTPVTQTDILNVFTAIQTEGNKTLDLNVTTTGSNDSTIPVLGQTCYYGAASSASSAGLQSIQCGPGEICATYYGTATNGTGGPQAGGIASCVTPDMCNACVSPGHQFGGYTVVTCERATCCNQSLCNKPVFVESPQNVTCPMLPANAGIRQLRSDYICEFIGWAYQMHHVWHPTFQNWRQRLSGVVSMQAQCFALSVQCDNANQYATAVTVDGCTIPYCKDGYYSSGPGLREYRIAQAFWKQVYAVWQNSNTYTVI
uniref:VWFA domain-containing protein n=1 Tax=Ciona savignyi TaxID=51511 RepID=H2ZCM6_CIOSA